MQDDRPDPIRDTPADSDETSQAKPVPDSEQVTNAAHEASAGHEQIGSYRILERIGTGGMGEVYRAEQTDPIRRTVALKVIKLGMDTQEVIARFEVERQALALMDHPCIAKVFDAGSTPRGRPYFVMEYVRGEPINTYCDREKLTTRERLALFIQLCEGVQHAHQKAIIHRDLKPSNVLVTIQDDNLVPKIIDFGVVKATAQKLSENTMFTALGELIGTPEYMSPEQAEMTGTDVDTRADVYSLGVILYELLAGALPFEPGELRKAGFAGIVRTLREQDPPRPSNRLSTLGERTTAVAAARGTHANKLTNRLRGDLDWITMRALEKNRTRRYGSAADLAADVKRHLAHEPVLAGPPSPGYRTRKFVRRHRTGVAFAAVLLLVLAGFGVTMAMQAGRIAAERDRANVEAERANEEAARANSEAQAAVDVTEFLVGMFETSDPWKSGEREIDAQEILDRGADRIQRELKDQPLLRARMMDAMGRVHQNLGLYDDADELLQNALELRETELGDQHLDVAQSRRVLASLRRHQSRFQDGIVLARRALEVQQELLGLDHVETAWSLYHLGSLEGFAGCFDDSRAHLEQAREIFERRLGEHTLAVSWCWQDLGVGWWNAGNFSNALECFKRALEIKKQVFPPDHPDIAISVDAIGAALSEMGDYSAALLYNERAHMHLTESLGADHFLTGRVLLNVGVALRGMGRHAAAREALQSSLAICQEVVGERSIEVASIQDELGVLEHLAGKHAAAESLFSLARAVTEESIDADGAHMILARLMERQATCLRELKREADAEALEIRARTMRETLDQPVTCN